MKVAAIQIAVITVLIFIWTPALAQPADPDADYVARFEKQFMKADPPHELREYASQARYDALYMGANLDATLSTVDNDQGGMAWGLSYRMMSLNDMFRATGETKYLEANLRCIRAVLGATDEKRGKALWTGRVVQAWGCEKYARRGRAVFAVHTGIICAPIFDCLLQVQTVPALRAQLGAEFEAIRDQARAALAVHDRQWVDGPEAGEGHYIGLDQEDVLENKPLPGNRLSAMAWALWLSHKLDGEAIHGAHARLIGEYIKRRLTRTPDGAYFWPYSLPVNPVTEPAARESVAGEDSSHAALTMAVVLALAEDGEVFGKAEMACFCQTVLQGFGRREDGLLFGCITGEPKCEPEYVALPSRWLGLSNYDPRVLGRILAFYKNYGGTPAPLEIADLILAMQKD